MKTILFENIKRGFSWILAVAFLSACGDDFLELEPTDAISEDQVFESEVITQAALVGVYDILGSPNFEGLYVPIYGDLVGEDIMINSVDNWNWFVPVYQMEILPNYTYTDNPWWTGYKLIGDASRIIGNVQSVPDATEEEKNRMEGEARALRAYAMLKLAQMYSPAYARDSSALSILVVNEPKEVGSEDMGRSSLQEVYNQIETDLTAAINLLEENDDKGFLDQRAAKAILARMYLDQGKWAEARDMAKEAYEGLQLMSVDEMYTGFSTRNSETIFSLAYTQDDNNVYLSLPSFYWPVSGYSSMRANDLFVDQFSSQDYRRSFLIQLDDIDPDRNIILKFGHVSAVGDAERICIRASEMYLIEAECEAELGNYGSAQDALYEIQKRANPAAAKSTATGQNLVDEVLMERRKELFGEGFRWNDIKRRQLPFKREGDHWVTFDFNANDPDNYRLTYPIPQSEIDANTMINEVDQNEGY
ncbi:RagB/SusD family nutrient uptake outer membrane protein [Reichenbachiella sp.]